MDVASISALTKERAELLSAIDLAQRYSANRWVAEANAAPYRKRLAKIDEALAGR